MTVILKPDQFNPVARELTLGVHVSKAATTVPQAADANLFTVSTGRVLAVAIVGEVTTVIGGTAPTMKLLMDPTTGTSTDLCTATAITGDEVGSLYSIDGVGNALEVGSSGAVEGSSKLIVLPVGTLKMNVSAADATGAIKWSVIYAPLDDDAEVAAV